MRGSSGERRLTSFDMGRSTESDWCACCAYSISAGLATTGSGVTTGSGDFESSVRTTGFLLVNLLEAWDLGEVIDFVDLGEVIDFTDLGDF